MAAFPLGNLSLLLAIPVVGALALMLIPRRSTPTLFACALLFTSLDFLWSLNILNQFDGANGEMQLIERVSWVRFYGIEYLVGIDGISLFLILLTTFLMPVAILASWPVKDKIKEYLFFMLILETGMLGAFVALDLFLFYVFWEVMLVPMYFLIGVWGGTRRIYAAVKFVLYTMAGSLLMLVAIIYLATRHAQLTQVQTFDLLQLYNLHLPFQEQSWLFLAFALSFAIKVPLFPFHTWLPDAHVEAPTAGSVILAGVLLKMGTYGFLRFGLPIFPDASLTFGPIILALAVFGIVYGAWVSTVQPDLKKLVAYSSVSHLGFVVLGIFTLNVQGLVGGVIQMINHGLSTGALFLMVGMIYERRHTRLIADFGGLWKVIPAFSALFLVVVLSSLGLPGLNGFVGEFLILVGAFQTNRGLAALAMTGIIFAAVYLLWMYQRVIFGEVTHEENRGLRDLSLREWALIVPLVIFIVWIGVYPTVFTGPTEATVEALIAQVQSKASVA